MFAATAPAYSFVNTQGVAEALLVTTTPTFNSSILITVPECYFQLIHMHAFETETLTYFYSAHRESMYNFPGFYTFKKPVRFFLFFFLKSFLSLKQIQYVLLFSRIKSHTILFTFLELLFSLNRNAVIVA